MKSDKREPPTLRVPPPEQLLIDELPPIREARILTATLGRGQFAAEAVRQVPGAEVVLHEFDVYLADEARRFVAAEREASPATNGAGEGGVEVVCSADFPEREFDLAALPIDPRGEAELTRDLLQSAHCRLRTGGRLIAAISRPDDQWLHGELRKLFDKVTRRPSERGVLYLATRTGPLRKLKRFDREFAFRDRERPARPSRTSRDHRSTASSRFATGNG